MFPSLSPHQDADFCVTVYKAESPNSQEPWVYMGKHRAHYKHIRGITFGVALDSGASRLLSLGEDRALVGPLSLTLLRVIYQNQIVSKG